MIDNNKLRYRINWRLLAVICTGWISWSLATVQLFTQGLDVMLTFNIWFFVPGTISMACTYIWFERFGGSMTIIFPKNKEDDEWKEELK